MGRVSAVRAAITRAQMWPGIAQPALWARTAGSSFVFGAVLVALITALTPTSFDHAVLQYVNAAAALAIGIAVLLTGRRVTLVQFHLLVVTAILQITLSVTFATGAAAVSFATLYVFVGCAAFFVAWPTAVLYLCLAMLCSTTALAVTGSVPWWTGLVTAATTAAVGVIILALGQVVAKAELDEVTGLPNRRGFDRILSAEVGRASTEKPGPAVVLICVDAYAAVHQEFGDRAADALMQQLTSSWLGVLDAGHVLARRSDGELALMLPATTEQDAFALTQRLRRECTREFSAGVSAWAAGESSTPVLERADAARRRAQSLGRNRTMLESSELPPLAVQLREALAAEDIGVRYQPVMRLGDPDVVVGVEALLRWSPALGPDLNAGEVIRVAEDHDLIAALDQFVLRRACLDARWMRGRFPGLPLMLSVNVSGLELVKQDYATRVVDTLSATGWPADQLVLEVTETVLDVDRPSSIDALHELRRHGIRVAIDDFGTGYSSLSRLHTLPTDLLKLDGSFISSITAPSSTSAPLLLHAVAGLGDALRLPIVVEGVETAEQAAMLRSMGFPMAQGYFFGRPQSREDVVEMIGCTRTGSQPALGG
ncbi:bifunctional diguanylate cyclase/phosphodiesterase [Mycolicibacterium sp. 3033]|nr:bifunctional diguanylate cyclase/phosphodiesterase [Mycolicibacterium aurantiacum]